MNSPCLLCFLLTRSVDSSVKRGRLNIYVIRGDISASRAVLEMQLGNGWVTSLFLKWKMMSFSKIEIYFEKKHEALFVFGFHFKRKNRKIILLGYSGLERPRSFWSASRPGALLSNFFKHAHGARCQWLTGFKRKSLNRVLRIVARIDIEMHVVIQIGKFASRKSRLSR